MRMRMRIDVIDGLLLCQSQNLMMALALVLATADVDPIIATIGGLHDELVVIPLG